MDNLRLCRVYALMEQYKIDALLINDPVNVSYVCNRPSKDAWLLITFKKAWYITDFRYIQESFSFFYQTPFSVVQFNNSILKTVLQLAKKAHIKTIGFAQHQMTVDVYEQLKSLCSTKITLKKLLLPIESLRMVKDDAEIKLIKEAVKINLEAFKWIEKKIHLGLTEKDLLKQLKKFVDCKNVEFSFDPIIASGSNSAFPHAKVTEKKLVAGEPLLIDLGIEKQGYKSDLTRMFFLGKMSRSFKRELSMIKDAQWEAMKKIKHGALAKDIDATARKYLKKYNMDQYFGHSLGHGVGLDIHEMPRISSKSGAVLLENMVITIEPGVYLPNKYGVRLEEMVLVTKNGYHLMS